MRQTSRPYAGHLSERSSLKRFQAASLILVPRLIFSSIVLEAFMGWLHKAHMWQSTSLKWDRDNHWKILMHGHTYLSIYSPTHPRTRMHNLANKACDLCCSKPSSNSAWCSRYVECVTKRTCRLSYPVTWGRKIMTTETQHWILLCDRETHHLSLCVSPPSCPNTDCLTWSWAYS